MAAPGDVVAGRERSRFVGRERELADLAGLCAEGAAIVTITGGPGVGKTRLARRFVELYAERFSSGAVFVDLTDARRLDDLDAMLSSALDLAPAEATERAGAGRIGTALAARGALLIVLDNFEQLVEHAAQMVGAWSEAAPEATWLVTSRERLRIDYEQTFPLGALPLPDADDPGGIRASHAVQLFEQRARLVAPSWRLADADAAAVAALVRALDGIPLAIELCAARASVLAPTQLLGLVERRFELLRGGVRGAPERQATLRAAIDWSWELLDPAQRCALAQCAVFRGGFDLAAAERVLSPSHAALGALDAVQALVDRSLLLCSEVVELPGELRYRLYESIRAYAAERLTELGGVQQLAATRHAEHYAATLERCAAEVHGPQGSARRRKLALEADNALAARQWALAAATPEGFELAARVTLALESVFATRGRLDRFVAFLDQSMAHASSLAPGLLARMHLARGLARVTLDNVLGGDDLARAVDLACSAGDAATEAMARAKLALASARQGSWEDARTQFTAACDAAQRSGEAHILAQTTNDRGLAHVLAGRFEDAHRDLERAILMARGVGATELEGAALINLGVVHFERQDAVAARQAVEDGVGVLLAGGHRQRHAAGLAQLGAILHQEGDLVAARARLDEAVALLREMGARRWESIALRYLANVAFEEGSLEEARARYDDAIAILREVVDFRNLGFALAGAAGVDARLGRLEEAASGFSEAEPLLRQTGRARDLALLERLRELVTLELARRAEAAGDVALAEQHRARAQGRHEALADARDFAFRILAAGLARGSAPSAPPRAAREGGTEGRWAVQADGRRLRTPSARTIRLERRLTLSRLLQCLTEARLRAAGKALTTVELVERVWPGQRIRVDSAANRLRVAINTLRNMGLRNLLLSRDGGYLLDPRCPLDVVDEV